MMAVSLARISGLDHGQLEAMLQHLPFDVQQLMFIFWNSWIQMNFFQSTKPICEDASNSAHFFGIFLRIFSARIHWGSKSTSLLQQIKILFLWSTRRSCQSWHLSHENEFRSGGVHSCENLKVKRMTLRMTWRKGTLIQNLGRNCLPRTCFQLGYVWCWF